MIELVISGGQTGADQAGWRAAKAAGIKTGGFMPRGFWAEDGNHPEFAEMYGASEVQECGKRLSGTEALKLRTWLNVRQSTATVLFGSPHSPGSRLTLRYANQHDRPCLTIQEREAGHTEYLSRMVEQLGIKTINVAGNRESSAPGIGAWVEAYLTEVFRLIRGH